MVLNSIPSAMYNGDGNYEGNFQEPNGTKRTLKQGGLMCHSVH